MADKTVSMPAAKRKRVTKTFKNATSLNFNITVKPILSPEGQIRFHVNSQNDTTKIYNIEYKVYGTSTTPRLVCNCGHQFGRDDRDHCKHIAAVILYQMTQLSFATNNTAATSSPPLSAFDESTLINMFKSLGAEVVGKTEFFKSASFKYEKVKKTAPAAPAAPLPPMALPPTTYAASPHPAFASANPFLTKSEVSSEGTMEDYSSIDPPEDADPKPSTRLLRSQSKKSSNSFVNYVRKLPFAKKVHNE